MNGLLGQGKGQGLFQVLQPAHAGDYYFDIFHLVFY
jgi:hypothetical protein